VENRLLLTLSQNERDSKSVQVEQARISCCGILQQSQYSKYDSLVQVLVRVFPTWLNLSATYLVQQEIS